MKRGGGVGLGPPEDEGLVHVWWSCHLATDLSPLKARCCPGGGPAHRTKPSCATLQGARAVRRERRGSRAVRTVALGLRSPAPGPVTGAGILVSGSSAQRPSREGQVGAELQPLPPRPHLPAVEGSWSCYSDCKAPRARGETDSWSPQSHTKLEHNDCPPPRAAPGAAGRTWRVGGGQVEGLPPGAQ